MREQQSAPKKEATVFSLPDYRSDIPSLLPLSARHWSLGPTHNQREDNKILPFDGGIIKEFVDILLNYQVKERTLDVC